MIIVATAGFKYDLCRLHTWYVVFDIYFPFQIVHWGNLLVSQANPERMVVFAEFFQDSPCNLESEHVWAPIFWGFSGRSGSQIGATLLGKIERWLTECLVNLPPMVFPRNSRPYDKGWNRWLTSHSHHFHAIPWTELKGLEPHGNDRTAIETFFSNVFWCLFSVFHMNKRYVYIYTYILIISSSKIFSCPPKCHVRHYFSYHVFQKFLSQRIPTSQLTSRAEQTPRAAKSKASKASKATKVRRCQQEGSPPWAVIR